MTLEFHTWPPQWVADLCRQAESAMSERGGQLDSGDVGDLLAAATELCGGDQARAQELAAHVLALPQLKFRPAESSPAQTRAGAVTGPPPVAAGPSPAPSDAALRFSAASSSRTDPDTLRRIAGERAASGSARALLEEECVHAAVAANPNTPPDVLTQLANDDRWTYGREWAFGSESLRDADRPFDRRVSAIVAGNPRTPGPTLAALARHPYLDVLVELAGNASTPGVDLRALADRVTAESELPYTVTSDVTWEQVRHALLTNPATPGDVRTSLQARS